MHKLSLSLSLSHAHILHIAHACTQTCTHTHILPIALTHAHTHTLKHPQMWTLFIFNTHTNTLSLSYTSTHPHTSTLSHSSILFLTLCAIHLTFWTKARFQEFRRKDVFEFKTLFFDLPTISSFSVQKFFSSFFLSMLQQRWNDDHRVLPLILVFHICSKDSQSLWCQRGHFYRWNWAPFRGPSFKLWCFRPHTILIWAC